MSIMLSVAVVLAMSPNSASLNGNHVATASESMHRQTVIVQQYGDNDPHGADPHGSDPHDENHDLGLKANSADNDRTAPSDVYGGRLGANTQHPLDNTPPR